MLSTPDLCCWFGSLEHGISSGLVKVHAEVDGYQVARNDAGQLTEPDCNPLLA